MSPENMLEARLRRWTPRRPSPNLKRRLFPVAPAPAAKSALPGLEWLVPVGAAFVLSLMALTTSSPALSRPRLAAQTRTTTANSWDHFVKTVTAEVNVMNISLEWATNGQSPSSNRSLVLFHSLGQKP